MIDVRPLPVPFCDTALPPSTFLLSQTSALLKLLLLLFLLPRLFPVVQRQAKGRGGPLRLVASRACPCEQLHNPLIGLLAAFLALIDGTKML